MNENEIPQVTEDGEAPRLSVFDSFLDALGGLGELRSLDVSDNGFKTAQLTKIVETLADEDQKISLRSLNLSHNFLRQMPQSTNMDPQGKSRQAELIARFYASLGQLISSSELLSLNLESMNLGNQAVCLAEPLLESMHLVSL